MQLSVEYIDFQIFASSTRGRNWLMKPTCWSIRRWCWNESMNMITRVITIIHMWIVNNEFGTIWCIWEFNRIFFCGTTNIIFLLCWYTKESSIVALKNMSMGIVWIITLFFINVWEDYILFMKKIPTVFIAYIAFIIEFIIILNSPIIKK